MRFTIYTAKWCGPCKQVKSWLESNGELDKVHFVNIDNPEYVIPLEVKTIPTLNDIKFEKIISGANAIIDYLNTKGRQ